jgi:hypothetical protein
LIRAKPPAGCYQAVFDALAELLAAQGRAGYRSMLKKFFAGSALIEPPPSGALPWCSDACREPGELFLFDPGIEQLPSAGEFALAPSQKLLEIAGDVEAAAERLRRLERERTPAFEDADLVLAVRMRDGPLLAAATAALAGEHALSGVGALLAMKGALMGVGEAAAPPPDTATASEAAALMFAADLIPRVMRLQRIE